MGWWPWDWISSYNDPLKDLDPSLREFVRNNTSKPYEPTSPSSDPKAREPETYRDKLGLSTGNPWEEFEKQREKSKQASQPDTRSGEAEDAPLKTPSESLYQDGRYAHLWKTYRPQSEIDDASKSDQEKLLDIVGGYQERTKELKEAAHENCSEFQWAVHDCFRNGGWSSRMTMCKAENRALSRCITMQTRFLRALGYMSVLERSEEETERMQMHADRLYHRMLKQEKLTEEAKKAGKDPPVFPPLMGPGSEQPRADEKGGVGVETPKPGKLSWDTITEEGKEMYWKERFQGLEGEELEIAKREFDAELAVHEMLEERLQQNYVRERREREQRYRDGTERLGDKVKRYLDFRKNPLDNNDEENKTK